MNAKNLIVVEKLVPVGVRRGREVTRSHSLVILIFVLAFVALAGIGVVVADPSVSVLAAGAAPSYVISCLMDTSAGTVSCLNGNQIPVCNKLVCDELVLKAHVENSSGNPAQRGSVIFQDCLLNGNPAPSAACVSGTGAWSHIITMSVDKNGNAEVDYGFVSTSRTIGFRFRYFGQGSGIANGESAPMDVTWIQ